VYIVQGPPGAGKTILANQVCFHHASTGGQAVYVTLLAESHSQMFAHLRQMTFFNEDAIPERIRYVGGYSTLQSGGLDALVGLIRGEIQKHRATLVVIDGLVSAQESAPTDREYKIFLHGLQTLVELTRCTVLLLINAERSSGFFPEHTMVDGVVHLTDELSDLRPLRHIRVLKLRGCAPVRGLHSLRITGDGIVVRPRIETLLPGPGRSAEVSVRGRSPCCLAHPEAARHSWECSSFRPEYVRMSAASTSDSMNTPRRSWPSVNASASAA
jgi:circadian clock protein KaiC